MGYCIPEQPAGCPCQELRPVDIIRVLRSFAKCNVLQPRRAADKKPGFQSVRIQSNWCDNFMDYYRFCAVALFKQLARVTQIFHEALGEFLHIELVPSRGFNYLEVHKKPNGIGDLCHGTCLDFCIPNACMRMLLEHVRTSNLDPFKRSNAKHSKTLQNYLTRK